MDIKTINKIDYKNIEEIKILGIGSFGKVKLVFNKKTNQYNCMKIIKKYEILKTKQINHIYSDLILLTNTNFPFIIKLNGISQNNKFFYIFLEYAKGGEFFNYLKKYGNLENKEAAFYSSQILLIFEYLHKLNFIYRDLKPENLLIDHKGYLKLTDFGFSKYITKNTYTLCGTPEYLAPELIWQIGHNKSVDWWCLGILIYEMMVGIDPFSDEDPMNVYQNILNGKVRFPKGFNKDAKDLIKNFLIADPLKRYGSSNINEIKEHIWFKNINWSNILRKKTKSFYIPESNSESSNISNYPESEEIVYEVKKEDDLFNNF